MTALFSCSFWQQDLQCLDCPHNQVSHCMMPSTDRVTAYLGFLDSVSLDTS